MTGVEQTDDIVHALLGQLRLPAALADQPLIRNGAAEVMTALSNFAELLPAAERPAEARSLVEHVAGTNAFELLRIERRLPVTVVFYSSIHPAYYEGENRIGEPPWRLCYTDGGGIGSSPARERLLDEV